jgi:hypothetical protein
MFTTKTSRIPVNHRRPRLLRLTLVAAAALALVAVPTAQASHQFTDVPADHQFHPEISIFKETNITSGCTATMFCPQDVVKRQAMAAFIDRALGLVVRPGEPSLVAVPGSRVAMIDDGASLVRTNAGGLELSHGGVRALRLVGGALSPNLIGGSSGNAVTAGLQGATIAGGGMGLFPNRVTDDWGTVGGGRDNQAGDAAGTTGDHPFATVGGGAGNDARGTNATIGGGSGNDVGGLNATIAGGSGNDADGQAAAIGGGQQNIASGGFAAVSGGQQNRAIADWATVGGGEWNTAFGEWATVSGGHDNYASGSHAAIAGGRSNLAQGAYSFAAGRRARANHNGAFVWGDSLDYPVESLAANSFTARTTGGARFITSVNALTGAPLGGVTLAPGAGSWSSLSDRAAKRDFRRVDGRGLLRRLAGLPITTWSYKSQARSIRHMGPTAQDFSGAFGLGEDARHITGADADGVALAGVQALYERNVRLERRNRELTARVARIERLLAGSGARR